MFLRRALQEASSGLLTVFLLPLQDLLLNDQVKEFAANVYEAFSAPQELQK